MPKIAIPMTTVARMMRGSRSAAPRSRCSQPRRRRIDAEQGCADPAGDGDGRRHAHMAVVGKQRERSAAAVASPASAASIGVRVSSWAKDTAPSDLLERVPGQSGADRGERCRDGGGIARAEGAALEQAAGDRLRQQREGDSRRKRQAERDLEPARLRRRDRLACCAPHALAAIVGTSTAAMAIETTPSGNS